MGCQQSAPISEVDKMLNAAHEEELLNPKILLLGAGESGKSTVVKQVKLVWKVGGGLTEREKQDYTNALKRNCYECIQALIGATRAMSISLSDSILNDANEIFSLATDSALDSDMAQKISAIWNDAGIQRAYDRRSEFWLLDATPYYMTEIHRFAEAGFEPNEDDTLMARVRTTGIVITQLPDPPYNYQIVDVGGQRSERRKWIHCFDNVDAIIFLEGLSGYNQVLFEDNKVNRMHESLTLFEDILKNPMFKKTPIFVFLNKKDLFEEMIPKYPLKKCFPDFEGPEGDMRAALDFIEGKYRSVVANVCPEKTVYIHVMAARLRMDIKVAFGEVKSVLKGLKKEKK